MGGRGTQAEDALCSALAVGPTASESLLRNGALLLETKAARAVVRRSIARFR